MPAWVSLLVLSFSLAFASDQDIDVSIFRKGPNAPPLLYAAIHSLMSEGAHPQVVAAVEAALESGVPDQSPPGIPISTLSFMKGMALYSMGRVLDAQEAFAASVLAGALRLLYFEVFMQYVTIYGGVCGEPCRFMQQHVSVMQSPATASLGPTWATSSYLTFKWILRYGRTKPRTASPTRRTTLGRYPVTHCPPRTAYSVHAMSSRAVVQSEILVLRMERLSGPPRQVLSVASLHHKRILR